MITLGIVAGALVAGAGAGIRLGRQIARAERKDWVDPVFVRAAQVEGWALLAESKPSWRRSSSS